MNQVQTLSVKEIRAGDNDRTVFQSAGIEELAQSIQQNGLIQPITVRTKDQGYEIVAGERRYRACANIL
ncbi:MAG: ParB/RepB/Spo0J family partition protein, partial [Chloroflexi bacterium]|nr:ParB/RepB/Spo0J family partition protein [Chloroflexota bacterium]